MNKKNLTKLYARALAEIIAKKPSVTQEKKVIDNFVKLLIKTNQERKAKEILDLAEDFILLKEGKRKIVFQTARKMTVSQKNILQSFVKKGDIFKEKINPELIAGVKIIINDSKQFDGSLQSKLQRIN